MWRRAREVGQRKLPDTPAMSRRNKPMRLLINRHHEAFPEEAEEVKVNTVNTTKQDFWLKNELPINSVDTSDRVNLWMLGPLGVCWAVGCFAWLTSIKPVQCKSVFYSSRPARTGKNHQKVVSPVSPVDKEPAAAWRPAISMTPDPFKRVESLLREEEQNLAVSPESITSSGTGTDATLSLDEDEEADSYSSASSSSSSLSSPEIFRTENSVETLTFPMKEETLDLHLHIKNSTLLDVSHAQNIHMHDLPNVSTISNASTPHVKTNREIRRPEAATGIQTDSFKQDHQAQAFKRKTPVKLTSRRPILCQKRVSFKSPVPAKIRDVKQTLGARVPTLPNTSGSAGGPSPAQQVKPRAEVSSGVGEMNSEDGLPHLRVSLKRPVKRIPGQARFFDFVSDGDRGLFFQRARERCVKLRSLSLFSSAAETIDKQKPVPCHP